MIQRPSRGKSRITRRAARLLQCTTEHLVARKDGGGHCAANIAAACLTCNRRRHQRKNDMPPDRAGKWHPDYLLRAFEI